MGVRVDRTEEPVAARLAGGGSRRVAGIMPQSAATALGRLLRRRGPARGPTARRADLPAPSRGPVLETHPGVARRGRLDPHRAADGRAGASSTTLSTNKVVWLEQTEREGL